MSLKSCFLKLRKNLSENMKTFEALIKENSVKCLSLDIFDTLLLRKVWPELSRYKKLARVISKDLRLQGINLDWRTIYQSRLKGLAISYRTVKSVNGRREGKIKDVIKYQLLILGLPSSLANFFLMKELELEMGQLIPNEKLLEICRSFKTSGGRLVLASDMYLDTGSIRKLLSHFSIESLFDEVYVSSDLGITKAGGELFDHILKTEGFNHNDVLHIGDNILSDFQSPRARGWLAHHLPRGKGWSLVHKMMIAIHRYLI
jgi:predicted HAD superfamily hydrolase